MGARRAAWSAEAGSAARAVPGSSNLTLERARRLAEERLRAGQPLRLEGRDLPPRETQQLRGTMPGHRSVVQEGRGPRQKRLLRPRRLAYQRRVPVAETPDRGQKDPRIELRRSLAEATPV